MKTCVVQRVVGLETFSKNALKFILSSLIYNEKTEVLNVHILDLYKTTCIINFSKNYLKPSNTKFESRVSPVIFSKTDVTW